MTDVVDAATRSRMMSGIKGKDTTPEKFLRRALHASGFRYRLGGAGLPGRPDLVLSSRHVAIFINGCFWHGHQCTHFKWPKSNPEFWKSKIESNIRRDTAAVAALEKSGWKVITVWECDLKRTKYQLPNERVLEVIKQLKEIKVI